MDNPALIDSLICTGADRLKHQRRLTRTWTHSLKEALATGLGGFGSLSFRQNQFETEHEQEAEASHLDCTNASGLAPACGLQNSAEPQ